MNDKNKKKVAPILVGIFISLILIIYISAVMLVDFPIIIKIVLGLMLLALIGVMIHTVIERLEEIEEGEEDDLSNY